jgi:aminopeptidase N
MHTETDDTINYMQTVPRLISNFKPKSYDLSIEINRKGRLFEGIVIIEGTTRKNNIDITLHSKGLDIESVTLDGKKADFTTSEYDSLIISHPGLSKGEHIVVISFSGKITDSMQGIYQCYYSHEGVDSHSIRKPPRKRSVPMHR